MVFGRIWRTEFAVSPASHLVIFCYDPRRHIRHLTAYIFTSPVPLRGLDFFTPGSGLSFLFFFYFSSTLPWPKPAVMGLRAISISFKVSKTGTRFRPKPLLQAEGNVVDDVFDNSKDSSRKLQVQLRETNRSWLISLFGYLKVGTKLEKLEVKESIDLETEFWVFDFSLVYVKKQRIVAYIFVSI